MKRLLPLVLALLTLAPASAALAAPPPPPDFDHVVIIVMENKEYGQIIGSRQAPYINDLADSGALATRFYAIRHPSLPNYLALLGGSTFGIKTNCTNCDIDAKNLVDQLEDAGISWKAYMGGMPRECYKGAYSGRYAKRHNPFMYFDSIREDRDRCRLVQPIEELKDDLAADTLPRFAFITPDLCKDMHDCSIRTGDRYLSRLVPKILTDLGTDGVLFLTFDEGSSSDGCCRFARGGHIATIAAGPAVPDPRKRRVEYDLYSILRTIEEAWSLPLLRKAGCDCTESMGAMFG